MKNYILIAALFVLSIPQTAFAQFESPDQFYRPVSSRDLVTKLPPRTDTDKLLSSDGSNFFDFDGNSGGCPESILIGSVDEDADVFGGVDIDVVIDSDITISCGGLR